MRVTYRHKKNKDYWNDRWSNVSADIPMENTGVYPLKYAELTIRNNKGRILEAGCGAGRLLRYYHDKGYDIVGVDFIEAAVEKLKEADPTLHVEVGDITSLRFDDESFEYVLAFGLYHNFENISDIEKAISETKRVLQKGGRVCASFRADNIQNRVNDWLAERRQRKAGAAQMKEKHFHKMNLTSNEFVTLFENAGLRIEQFYTVENMPILYKFKFCRATGHKEFNESLGRIEGYRLSPVGSFTQRSLIRFFPKHLCNIYVIIGEKL